MPLSTQLVNNLRKTTGTSFSMIGCDINSEENIKEFCTELKSKLQISSINLSQNQLFDKGAKLLAKYLPDSIQTINLTRTDIGDSGLKALLKCKNIIEVIVAGNNLISAKILTNPKYDWKIKVAKPYSQTVSTFTPFFSPSAESKIASKLDSSPNKP